MDNTAIRFYNKETHYKNSIFGLYFLVKLFFIFSVISIVTVFHEIFFHILKKSEMIPFLPFLAAGFLGEALFFVNDTYLQAIQNFKLRSLINISQEHSSVWSCCITFHQ